MIYEQGFLNVWVPGGETIEKVTPSLLLSTRFHYFRPSIFSPKFRSPLFLILEIFCSKVSENLSIIRNGHLLLLARFPTDLPPRNEG